MKILGFFVGGVLPYVAVSVFGIGMAFRFWTWARIPQPARMTLFPAPDSTFRGVLAEVLLFPSLYRGDKTLWTFSWIFHATLALVFLGHVRVFSVVIDRLLTAAGMSAQGLEAMSRNVGGLAGIVLLATGLLLSLRRATVARVRSVSRAPDFLALLLLIAIVGTGNLMRFGVRFDLEQTRVWAASLVAFRPIVPTDARFLIHALLAMILLMYVPFSKILHFGGIFFTQSLIKRS